jgi:hypothetical protein
LRERRLETFFFVIAKKIIHRSVLKYQVIATCCVKFNTNYFSCLGVYPSNIFNYFYIYNVLFGIPYIFFLNPSIFFIQNEYILTLVSLLVLFRMAIGELANMLIKMR